MKSVTYVDNEYICKKGEEGNVLFIIKSGEVRVTNNIEGGEGWNINPDEGLYSGF